MPSITVHFLHRGFRKFEGDVVNYYKWVGSDGVEYSPTFTNEDEGRKWAADLRFIPCSEATEENKRNVESLVSTGAKDYPDVIRLCLESLKLGANWQEKAVELEKLA